MSGRHPFSRLTKDFSPERRARVDALTSEMLAAIPLHEIRKARAMTRKLGNRSTAKPRPRGERERGKQETQP